MSNFKAIGLIKLSMKDVVLSGGEALESLDKSLACYIKINQKVFDIVLFNRAEPAVSNLIGEKAGQIEILLKNVKRNGLDYGQIGIDLGKLESSSSITDW